MTNSFDSVLESALTLNDADRARVAERLIQSLSNTTQAEIDAVWIVEAERRLQAFREGKIQSFAADEVFASLLSRNGK